MIVFGLGTTAEDGDDVIVLGLLLGLQFSYGSMTQQKERGDAGHIFYTWLPGTTDPS